MRFNATVITQFDPLNIREAPGGLSSRVIGSLPKGSQVYVNNVTDIGGINWYQLEDGRGWVCGTYLDLGPNLDETQQPVPIVANTIPENIITTETNNDDAPLVQSTDIGTGIDAQIIANAIANNNNYEKKIDASTRLFGCPFQFTAETDFRVPNINIGRKYLETIISESPICFFTPGKPSYLPDISEKQRSALNAFFNRDVNSMEDAEAASNKKTLLSKILGNKDVRYFDFKTDYAEYIRYVNLLCRICSIYLGINEKYFGNSGTKYGDYNWANYKYKNDYKPDVPNEDTLFVSEVETEVSDFTQDLFGQYHYVQFYADVNSSFSESASNQTTQSMLESAVMEKGENIAKEISFLTSSAALQGSFVTDAQNAATSAMDSLSARLKNGGKESIFSRLLDTGKNVISGSNMLFPEIWQDASYGKNYTVNINLVSPYGTKEAVYLNILVPLMHILAFSLPRQTSANSFMSPFLVKTFAKGWFSCELGIVDSITIDKANGGDAWSVDGLPLEVKVSISIKDLYSNLMITPANKATLFLENQGLINFLAVTCGVDITKPNFLLKLETIYSVLKRSVFDLPQNVYSEFIQGVRKSIEPYFKI